MIIIRSDSSCPSIGNRILERGGPGHLDQFKFRTAAGWFCCNSESVKIPCLFSGVADFFLAVGRAAVVGTKTELDPTPDGIVKT
eukprot:g51829.t1